MNINGDGYGRYPGDEYLPTEYLAQNLPTSLDIIRQQLFGSDPDRVMRNYRCQQLLRMLHATELEEFVLDPDPRITYDPAADTFLHPDNFMAVAKPLNTTQKLYFAGSPGSPDDLGRCYHQWNIDVISDSTVEVIRRTRPVSSVITEYTVTDKLSSLVPLHGSGLMVRFGEGSGAQWRIEATERPTRTLGQMEAMLRQIGEPHMLTLFGVGSARGTQEPWLTFRNLWTKHHELPYSLGGLVLALIYYTDQVRLGAL